MIGQVILQAAMMAGLVVLFTILFIFITGFVLSFLFFTNKELKKSNRKTSFPGYLFRVLKSLIVALALIIIFMTILFIWNPQFE